MALGAGVLVSSVAFELMDEAYKIGGLDAAAPGLLLGAAVFYLADREVNRRGGERRKNMGDEQGGSATAIAIGALLDGIPESAAIGISLIESGGVGIALVAAVFLSNIPEGLSSAAGMKRAGRSPAYVLGLWGAVTLASTLAALLGYLFLAGASGNVVAAIQSFAAGAILTMLASTMMPEAYEEGDLCRRRHHRRVLTRLRPEPRRLRDADGVREVSSNPAIRGRSRPDTRTLRRRRPNLGLDRPGQGAGHLCG